jgi:hypothetical protein
MVVSDFMKQYTNPAVVFIKMAMKELLTNEVKQLMV